MSPPDDPTPDEQRRYEDRGGDDELMGTVFVLDDREHPVPTQVRRAVPRRLE